MKVAPSKSPATITVHVPLRFTTRGNTKRIVGAEEPEPQIRIENSLIKALARAHRWRLLIEGGAYVSITELAKAKGVNQSYACRLLRLTLLGPEVVVAILDGRLNPAPTVNELMKPFPLIWTQQKRVFAI